MLAYNEETGEQAYKPVLQLFKNETKQWCTVCVDVDGQEEQITSTPGHKYYLPNNTETREVGVKQEHESYTGLSEKWVSACKLKAGDKVLLSNGEYGIIQSVKVEELSSPETTYNLEVEDFHTYYVGENSVCVHNKNCNVNQMNEQIRKGQAPRDVKRIDDANSSVKNSKVHAHFKNGTSLNMDGTIHDAKGGVPQVNRATREWLEKYGWKVPNIYRR